MSWRSPAQGGLQSLDTMSQLLRGRANRYAWLGLVIAVLAILAATLLSCQYEQGGYSWAGLLAVKQRNPALWALDAMPLIFLVWGQYIGSYWPQQVREFMWREREGTG